MQKNTKDSNSKKTIAQDSIEKKQKVAKKSTNTSTKKATTGVKKSNALDTVKKVPEKKTTAKKSSVSEKSTAKKATTKKATKSTTAKKATTTSIKNTVAKKSTTSKKRTTIKKTSTLRKKTKSDILEYYDLPYRYNQTVVKILAQTPSTIFVYWDISDADRKKYVEEFGENFFESTFPVLIVHNRTMNYSFEIEINDFANSWYFNVNDAKCNYEIELGRRSRNHTVSLPNNYMHVVSSNTIEAPNNHILFEKNQKTLFFRNVKTNYSYTKDISQFEFMKYIGRIYNIYDVYKKMYKNDELQDLEKNPTSWKK